jgi:hypothetical protein
MDKEELIRKFHQKMKNQILKEYKRQGNIKNKVILLLIDGDNSPTISVKNISGFLNEEGERLEIAMKKLQYEVNGFIHMVERDGYDVVSLYHVEYCEDDDEIYTSLKFGEGLETMKMCRYQIVRESTKVLSDGSLQMSEPKFELIEHNW